MSDFEDGVCDNDGSKTKQKQQMRSLFELGLRLSKLPNASLLKLGLSEDVLAAVSEYQRIRSNVAKKRQGQYMAKCLRRMESVDEIVSALDKLDGKKASEDALFHLCERWRERLLSGDKSALTSFLNDYPNANAQVLRHAIIKALKEQDRGQNLGAYKALFRLIREFL